MQVSLGGGGGVCAESKVPPLADKPELLKLFLFLNLRFVSEQNCAASPAASCVFLMSCSFIFIFLQHEVRGE